MKQYYVIYKDKSFEYVDAYGYKNENGRYIFDTGHGSTYQITADLVKSIEVL